MVLALNPTGAALRGGWRCAVKVRSVSTINATIAAILGVNLLLVPTLWIKFNGATADPQGRLLFQLIVFLFAGLAMITRTGRTSQTPGFGRGLRQALIAANGLAGAVAVLGAADWMYNQFAWGPVVMLSMLALGFVFVRPGGGTLERRATGSPAATSPLSLRRQTFQD
jgi:hypothetical protein